MLTRSFTPVCLRTLPKKSQEVGVSTNLNCLKTFYADSDLLVAPFGRIHPIRKDLVKATQTEAEGGNGTAEKFWQWTEDQVRKYV